MNWQKQHLKKALLNSIKATSIIHTHTHTLAHINKKHTGARLHTYLMYMYRLTERDGWIFLKVAVFFIEHFVWNERALQVSWKLRLIQEPSYRYGHMYMAIVWKSSNAATGIRWFFLKLWLWARTMSLAPLIPTCSPISLVNAPHSVSPSSFGDRTHTAACFWSSDSFTTFLDYFDPPDLRFVTTLTNYTTIRFDKTVRGIYYQITTRITTYFPQICRASLYSTWVSIMKHSRRSLIRHLYFTFSHFFRNAGIFRNICIRSVSLRLMRCQRSDDLRDQFIWSTEFRSLDLTPFRYSPYALPHSTLWVVPPRVLFCLLS